MLPLVQMHPMVQPATHRDSIPKHDPSAFPQRRHHASRMTNALHGLVSAHRGFPIRASQPSQPGSLHPRSSGFSHHADGHEHRLRRKTPNGTIDAGYDGTPTQYASGPPPLKHMIFPGPGNIVSSPGYDGSLKGGWPYRSSPCVNGAEPRAFDMSDIPYGNWHYGSPAAITPDNAANAPPNAYYPYHNGIRVPTALQPTYHHSPGPAVFNNGGLLPTPTWPDTVLPGTQNTHLGGPSHLMMSRPYVSPTPNASNMLARYDRNFPSIQTPAQRLESLTLDSGNYDMDSAHLADSSPAFREKALARAHRSYVDLLAYLHRTKKRFSSRYSNGSKSSSRMTIFPKIPKPPKHPGSQLGLHRQRPSYDHVIPVDGAARTANAHYGPSPVMMGLPQPVLPDVRQPNGVASPHARVSADTTSIPYYQMFNSESSHYGTPELTSTFLTQAPVENAKAAVEMLNHLCELSGWKWIDGMLLGGCLYYGLERYEDALDWFTRVVALDDSHTEALSNAAATLYCLHRNDEAEQHWLQAVRRDPSYLEAVEHLVGLLCSSQRSKEAVEIIDRVQDALRVMNSPPPRGWDGDLAVGYNAVPGVVTHALRPEERCLPGSHPFGPGGLFLEQAGFASSGYRVPGSENGRVIALIHAKGNMLYAHKDISKASEAFEEAVLISAGRRLTCIQALIQQIVAVLSPGLHNASGQPGPMPLLLPPERARHTARLVFANNGELPGLRFVPEPSKRSAVSTTSNSLLSLAKIFQDAMSSGASSGGPVRQPSGVGDILALYYLSLSLSESPSTANNVGILLASVQQSGPATSNMAAESAANQTMSGIIPGSGLDLALAYYKYGLSLDAKHVHLHTNLGSLLKDIGQLDLAIQMYEQAVACDGNFDIALTNLANAVKDRGRINDAITYYRRAVQSNPQFAEAVCGLFTALNSVCDWTDRGGVILHGGKYDRWHVDANGMLQDAMVTGIGSGLVSKVVEIVSKQLAEASHWGAGVLDNGVLEAIAPQLRQMGSRRPGETMDMEAELRRWSRHPWEGTRVLRLVERSTKATMRRWYRDKYVDGRTKHPASYARLRLPASLAVPSAPTVLPFHTFTCPLTAKDIRIISQRNAVRISCSTLRSPWLPDSVYPPPPPPKPHLNVGYVSSDFNNHPLAHLMQSVFGMHDPTKAKAFCYATTASDKSCHRQQIEREAPVFRDVSSWSAERLVNQIVQDEIHILVNLNGYTRGARNEIFAARPAPIQMSFMGFAGTLGAEWCDYILADETAVPPSTLRPARANLRLEDVFRDEEQPDQEDWVYSENVVFCRDTFFCCDHAQSCGPEEKSVTWEQEQQRRWKMRKELFPRLPDDAIILGNFNQLYKIDPATFRTWLRILSNVPNAFLWLLRFPELGETNLRRTARRWASEEVASRIIFTDVAPKQQHIGRARVCDLFLDTPECNAHTTAADVLWSSSPLLTLPRYPYKMCSRMAASILKGALPKSSEGERAAKELIATDEEDYERLATRLARGLSYQITSKKYGQGHGRLAEMRKMLFDAKWSCALFDTRRWVSDLEDAYAETWRRWATGEDGDIYL